MRGKVAVNNALEVCPFRSQDGNDGAYRLFLAVGELCKLRSYAAIPQAPYRFEIAIKEIDARHKYVVGQVKPRGNNSKPAIRMIMEHPIGKRLIGCSDDVKGTIIDQRHNRQLIGLMGSAELAPLVNGCGDGLGIVGEHLPGSDQNWTLSLAKKFTSINVRMIFDAG